MDIVIQMKAKPNSQQYKKLNVQHLRLVHDLLGSKESGQLSLYSSAILRLSGCFVGSGVFHSVPATVFSGHFMIPAFPILWVSLMVFYALLGDSDPATWYPSSASFHNPSVMWLHFCQTQYHVGRLFIITKCAFQIEVQSELTLDYSFCMLTLRKPTQILSQGCWFLIHSSKIF